MIHFCCPQTTNISGCLNGKCTIPGCVWHQYATQSPPKQPCTPQSWYPCDAPTGTPRAARSCPPLAAPWHRPRRTSAVRQCPPHASRSEGRQANCPRPHAWRLEMAVCCFVGPTNERIQAIEPPWRRNMSPVAAFFELFHSTETTVASAQIKSR